MTHNQSNSLGSYTQLTEGERGIIDALWHSHEYSIRDIAHIIHHSPSTVSRELKRGRVQQRDSNYHYYKDYFFDAAQRQHEERQTHSHAKSMLEKCTYFFNWLTAQIKKHAYREQSIDGYVHQFQQLWPNRSCPSTPTVYRYIDAGLLSVTNMDLPEKLRRREKRPGRSHARKNKRIAGTSIDKRPKQINNRWFVGDWEGDLVKGKRSADQPALLTLTERVTRYELIYKIPNYHARTCLEAMQYVLNTHDPYLFHSITFDNGSEFALLDQLRGTKIYYCHPYTPSERGSNENANGLIREFMPKGQSLWEVSKEKIRKIQDVLNHRLRKCLGYRSAIAALQASPLGLEESLPTT